LSTQSQTTVTDQSILPAGLDLSNISASVISQVREEYLSKKTSEDKLKNATTITPEVLVAIGNMVKETNIIQVLRKCKERQDRKEKELYSHRESIKERYKKHKENTLAK
jgi:ethanolamine ammonia-lyase large subunit